MLKSTGARTKARIVEAALESLHEEGILGASARAIAKRGDFNQGLIFYHFGSLAELLLAAVDKLSEKRSERYETRLEAVATLPELVKVAGQLHREDMEQGHITVLSQMLAAAATDPTLREPLRERFEPWLEIVERTVTRALGDTPYAEVVPAADLAFAVTALFIGLELLLNLEDNSKRDAKRMFATFELLGSVLQVMLTSVPPPDPT